MKKRGATLLETKYLENQTLLEKSITLFFPRPLIFKLQQEVLKFNYICVSWSLGKTDLETNFLNLENRS